MLRKLLSLGLIIAVFGSMTVISAAVVKNGDEEKTEKVKTEIRKLGTGTDAQIKLELQDKTKIEGYVSEANDNDFTVVNLQTGKTTTVPYPQVRKARGNNLSGGVKIAISIGIAVALTYLSYKYGRRNRRFGF